jgi:hypothetical protein
MSLRFSYRDLLDISFQPSRCLGSLDGQTRGDQ